MSSIAVFVILGGGAYAATTIPGPNGVINGCYQKKVGTLRVITAKQKCSKKNEITLSWNQRGVRGPTGATGGTGLTGASGAKGSIGLTGLSGAQGTDGTNGVSIATFASLTPSVATGDCLTYTVLGSPGEGPCPPATPGFPYSTRLLGPVPAGGLVVSDLYAVTDAIVTGADTAVATIIDNTTSQVLLACTVDSTTVPLHHCSNTSSSSLVPAGDNLEVQINASGSADNAHWRVTFAT